MNGINVGDWVGHPAWGDEFGPVVAVGEGVIAVVLRGQVASAEGAELYTSRVRLETDLARLELRVSAASGDGAAYRGISSQLVLLASHFDALAREAVASKLGAERPGTATAARKLLEAIAESNRALRGAIKANAHELDRLHALEQAAIQAATRGLGGKAENDSEPDSGLLKHRALCIDATARAITVREISFEEAREFIGGYAEPVKMGADDVLLVDEEGLLKRRTVGFRFRNALSADFVGNGVVFGTSGAEFCDCRATPAALEKLGLEWFGKAPPSA